MLSDLEDLDVRDMRMTAEQHSHGVFHDELFQPLARARQDFKRWIAKVTYHLSDWVTEIPIAVRVMQHQHPYFFVSQCRLAKQVVEFVQF